MVTSIDLAGKSGKAWIIAVVVTVVVLFSLYHHFQVESVAAHDMLVKQKEEYEKTIAEMNRIQNEEREALRKNEDELRKKLDEEKRRYEVLVAELENKKKDRSRKIIEEHGNDPEALANLMAERFKLRR